VVRAILPAGVPALAAAALLGPAATEQASAARAVAGIQDDRLGVARADEIDDRLKLVAATRARVVRVDLLWQTVSPTKPRRVFDPRDPAYDWSRMDAIVRGLAKRGTTPIVTVYGAPAWATGGRRSASDSGVNSRVPNLVHYARFMRAASLRYSGRFRPRDASRRLPEVRHWEIWNEPNLNGFLRPQVWRGQRYALRRYIRMTRLAYPMIKRSNRRSVVIGGVAGPRGSTGRTGTGAIPWARALARSSARFDAYSQHVYPAAGPLRRTRAVPAWSTLPRIIDELDRVRKRRGMKLYVTEAGYTTAKTPYRSTRVSMRRQASYLRQIFRTPVARSGRVPVVVWFNLQDNEFWPAGLLRRGGKAKPSLRAFRAEARRGRLPAALRPGRR
jgi:hypothetical protein